ncbi:MAG: nucleotidyltransferase family protein [Candidatus Niyogibacteria bacterium]|nr:nucleotidyltransferase family protein [Candidatus Niyogibacteria bacterium]
MRIAQAVIVAGGKGVRLHPYTLRKQKAMVPVLGRPFLEYLIDLFKKNGVINILLLLGYKPESVIDYFGDGRNHGVNITYSVSPAEIQNGTRLRNAVRLLDDHFLFHYCDIYWPLDIEKHLAFFKKNNLPALMTVFHNKRDGKGEYAHGNIKVNEEGIIEYYGPFQDDPSYQGNDIGFYILKKDILRYMPEGDFMFQDFISQQLVAEHRIGAFITDDPYTTITNAEWLQKTEEFFKTMGYRQNRENYV